MLCASDLTLVTNLDIRITDQASAGIERVALWTGRLKPVPSTFLLVTPDVLTNPRDTNNKKSSPMGAVSDLCAVPATPALCGPVDQGKRTGPAPCGRATHRWHDRQIAMLESEWGGRLFERTGRGMALFDFGRRMYPEVKHVVDQVRQLDASASEAAGDLTGTVHVGVLPSLSHQLLPLLLAEASERAPALRLHVI